MAPPTPGRAIPEIPVACTLTAAEQEAWSEGIGKTVFSGYEEVQELSGGYALRYPGDAAWAATLVAFIAHERACCPFFTFALYFEADHGAIWLRLTGSDTDLG